MSSLQRQYFYSVGKRKNAIACVRLYQDGSGTCTVNTRKLKEYFHGIGSENALAPLDIVRETRTFDIEAKVYGGGKSAQSDAVRLGISRALILCNPEWRPELKRAGFLRRDARIKERKKPGLKRARRAPQFSKR
ncbi:30S ribosomal protein S9 [Candidatus Peregrinibacteria bacterium]|nr:30S ribosomal protein S9 [Candidatus Peregrinibacteria bacterium]